MLKINWADDKAQKHYQETKDYLLKKIKSILAGGSVTVDGATYQLAPNDKKGKKIFEMFSTEKGLFDLITGRPDKLRDIICEIQKTQKKVFNSQNNINKILYNIFISNTYDGKKQENKISVYRFDKAKFIRNIGVLTCPYCNRAYIYTIQKNNINKVVVKPQIDHYFPKSIYPFLGMSYYNLIPSCTLCNGFENKSSKSPIKSNSNPHNSILIVNPYEIDLSKFKYSFEILNPDYFDVNSYKVLLNFPSHFEQNYEEFFGLATLYKEHKDHVQELFLKKQKYNEVSQHFSSNTVHDKDIEDDFERLYYGYYSNEDDFHKRPLSKFYHDILSQDDTSES